MVWEKYISQSQKSDLRKNFISLSLGLINPSYDRYLLLSSGGIRENRKLICYFSELLNYFLFSRKKSDEVGSRLFLEALNGLRSKSFFI